MRRAGVEHWHPQYLEYDAEGPTAHSLFPGYAFARMADQHLGPVTRMPGVLDVVRFGGELARIPERVWTELRAMCGPSGYVRLKPRFNRWSRVRLVEGDTVGIVQERISASRVRVLFKLLGQPVEVSVADGDLVAA